MKAICGVRVGSQLDPPYQFSEVLVGLVNKPGMGEQCLKFPHGAHKERGTVGRKLRQDRAGLLMLIQLGFKIGHLAFELFGARFVGAVRCALLDRIKNPLTARARFLKTTLEPSCGICAFGAREHLVLRFERGIEARGQFRCQEGAPELREDTSFYAVSVNGRLVVARAFAGFAASKMRSTNFYVSRAAAAADKQTAQQVLAAPRPDGITLTFGLRGLDRKLCFHAIPEILIDNPQRRNFDLRGRARGLVDLFAASFGVIAA